MFFLHSYGKLYTFMKKNLVAFIFFISSCFVFAKESVFRLFPIPDSLCLAGAVAAEISASCMPHPDINSFSKSDINSFDRKFMHDYDFNLDVAGWVLIYSLAGGQLALNFTAERDEWFTVLVMSVQTILISDSIKNFVKRSVGRERPYTYYSDYPDRADSSESFMSGHSINSFAIASFSSYVFSQYYPDSSWKWCVTGAAFTLAGLTAYSRIPAGCHFVSDVVCGAVTGSAIGFLVPYLHKKAADRKNRNIPEIAVLPQGFSIRLNL